MSSRIAGSHGTFPWLVLFLAALLPIPGALRAAPLPAATAAIVPTTSTLATRPAAPAANGTRIGFVDMDTVFRESRVVRERVEAIEKRLDDKRAEIARLSESYKSLSADLEKQDSLLNDEARRNRRLRLSGMKTEIDDLRYEANKLLRQSQMDVIEPATDAILKTVEDVAKRDGIDLVFDGNQVLYGAAQTDLTQRVIDALDANGLPKAEPAKSGAAPADTPRRPRPRDAAAPGALAPESDTQTLPLTP